MYNSLLLETGGGIISKNQVSPQQGDACVMIGIGGTGVAALRKLKKSVYQHLEPDAHTENSLPRYEKIRFLAIDTDSTDLGKSGGEISELGAGEQFSIKEPNLRTLLANPDMLKQEGNLGWMSMERIQMAGTDGAGGVRQVGRYCLFQKSGELRARISELLVGAREAAGREEVSVHIFAGISGGTGSGCFLDVCYIVRDILKNMLGNIYGYFFLPDIQLNRPGVMGVEAIEKWNKQNGYAAFRELDYLMSLPSAHETFTQNYGNFTVTSDKPPVDLCHLISGTNSEGVTIPNAYDYGLNVTADYVLSYLSQVQGDTANDTSGLTLAGHQANITQGLKMIHTKYGAERNYHILGASSAELPLTHIGTYLAAKTYEKLAPSLERHSSRDLLLNVARGLGYSFEGIHNLVVENVTFTPSYNKEAIDDPGQLNEGEKDWNVAIPAITQPLDQCRSAAIGVMERNEKAQSVELQTYNVAQIDPAKNPTFAARLFSQLITCCETVSSGPTIAAELLHSDVAHDLTHVMDGIIREAEEKQKYWERNLPLRVQDICTAAHTYNKAHLGKAKKLEAYLEARTERLKCALEIEACRRVQSLCRSFKQIISTLYANYFGPLREMLWELDQTFQANREWLKNPANLVNRDYCWRIFELSEVQDQLDETVLKNQQMEVEHTQFVRYLVTNFRDWRTQDSYRTGRCINEYMTQHFRETLSQSVDTFLSIKFGVDPEKLADKVEQEILQTVRSKAAPLFWRSPFLTLDNANTYKHSVLSIPAVSNAITIAADQIGDLTMVVRKCNVGDRITCVNFVSGIPLFAYQGVYELKTVYDNSIAAGLHLHEMDVNWKETLPTPIPYRLNPDATPNGNEKAGLYQQAVDAGVICHPTPDRKDEYAVRLIPDTRELVSSYRKSQYFRNGNLLESELNADMQKLQEVRETLLPSELPEGAYYLLANDGVADQDNPENDYTERVRIDYFVRFGGMRKAAETSLENLNRIDEKLAEMESWKQEKIKARKEVERYLRLNLTEKICYDANRQTETLQYKYGGLLETKTLSDLNMEFRSFHRYQAYCTLNAMEKKVLEKLDRELGEQFETPQRIYAERARKLEAEELDGAEMTKLRDKAERSGTAEQGQILNFYLTLRELAKELADLFEIPYPPIDERKKEKEDEDRKRKEEEDRKRKEEEDRKRKEEEDRKRKEEEDRKRKEEPVPQEVQELQEKLKKLKDMLNNGVLSQEEYEKYSTPIKEKMKELTSPPVSPLEKELKKLQLLFEAGLMDEETYKKEKEEAISRLL